MSLGFLIAAGTLWTSSVLLALWALFADRARGRLRCPACWYSMEGTEFSACPECGRTIKSLNDLRRTRRRYGVVAIALVVALGGVLTAAWPRARAKGWMSFVPTPVVIELLPLGGMDGPFGGALRRRLMLAAWPDGEFERTMTKDQQVYLVRRIARGNMLARPIGDRWRSSYGELQRQTGFLFDLSRLERGEGISFDGTPDDQRLIDAAREMLDLGCVVHVRTRDRWPAGMPVLIEFKVEHWWPMGVYDAVLVDWSANEGAATGQQHGLRGWAPFEIPLEGTVEVDLDVRVVQEHVWKQTDRRTDPVHQERAIVMYETVATIDDVMTPVGGDEIDRLIKDHVTVTWDDRLSTSDIDTRGLIDTPLHDAALGLRIEYYQDGVFRGWHQARGIGGTNLFTVNGFRSEGNNWPEGGTWTVIVRTDEAWCVNMLDAERYWRGAVELPLLSD